MAHWSLTHVRAGIACATLVACAAIPIARAIPAYATNAIAEDRSSSPDDDLSLKRDAGYPAGTSVYYVVRTTISAPDTNRVSSFFDVAVSFDSDGISIISPVQVKRHIATSPKNVQVFTDIEKVYVPPGSGPPPTVYPGKQPAYIIVR
jgi:hypothetical protein